MSVRSPDDMKKYAMEYAAKINEAIRSSVKVGLPAEKVGGKVYGDGMTIIRVGAIHEYGLGHNPVRSFLRVPFNVKRKDLAKTIDAMFKKVQDGMPVKVALGRIGITAVNISKDAFTNKGYGTWPDITAETKKAKGSSQVLIDTGTLRNSITHIVESKK